MISNCVINLVPDKKAAFKDAHRVLRPGGRIVFSDIVLLAELLDLVRDSGEACVGCVSGAALKEYYLDAMRAAGFEDLRVIDEAPVSVDFLASSSLAREASKRPGPETRS